MKMISDKKVMKDFYKRSLMKSDEHGNFVLGSVADVTLTKDPKMFRPSEDGSYTVYDKRMLEALHPDKLNSQVFWREATKHFPWIPIVRDAKCQSVEYANSITWRFHRQPMKWIAETFYDKDPNTKLLEIGPGYGGVKKHIGIEHGLDNYYCIDVNPLFEYERMFQTDGKTIPDDVPKDLDVVYSGNVFQHLSGTQRRAYFEQSHQHLKPGGAIVFSMFILTPENRDVMNNGKRLFGNYDKDGNAYSTFFNQFIRIPWKSEVVSELRKAGFAFFSGDPMSLNSHLFIAIRV